MIPAQGMAAKKLVIVLLVLVCGVGGFAGGVWVGIAWQQGRQAQQDNQVLKSDVEQLTQAALELRQRGVDIAQDFRTAHRRMESITEDREQFDARNREHFTRQRDALDALLATHPGIGDCDIGDAGMQHWNTSARGARATGPTTVDPDAAAPGVPGESAGTDTQRRGNDPEDVGPRGAAVPRLRSGHAGIDPGSSGVRTGGVGALLQGAGATEPDGARLHGEVVP